MTCQRCHEGPQTHRVRSDILDQRVCRNCASEAQALSAMTNYFTLTVEPLFLPEIDRDGFQKMLRNAAAAGQIRRIL